LRTKATPVITGPTTTVQVITQPIARRALASTLPATALFLVSVGLGGIGLVVNARFAASFGRSDDAAIVLAVIGVAVDVLSMVLPAGACQLWASGARPIATMTWALWPFAVGMSILAGVGFAATNIGDTLGTRVKVISEATNLRTSVARLKTERASISEARSVIELEARLEHDRAFVNRAIWIATRACHDVTVRGSAAACAGIMATRQALSTAARRDGTEAELRSAETKLATAPSISSGDPQAEAVADILSWSTAGRITPGPHDIARLRIIVLALAPSFAGLVLMVAARLWKAGGRTS